MNAISYHSVQKNRTLYQAAAVVLGGGLLFIFIVMLMTGIYRAAHAGRIMPGVRVAGVDVAGQTPADAAALLGQHLTYPTTGKIVLRDGNQVWVATPAELGMVFDMGASIGDAYSVGRDGGLFGNMAAQVRARSSGMDVSPVVVVDQRVAYTYLQTLAAQIDQPVSDADLHIENSQVVYTPGQVGRVLDLEASLTALEAQLQTFRDGEVTLVVHDQAPAVPDASAQAELARQILSAPLLLTLPNAQSGDFTQWSVDLPTLAGMLSITRQPAADGGQYQVSVNPALLTSLLTEIAGKVDHKPANARFVFNDSTHQLELIRSASSGQVLDVATAQQAIQTALLSGQHQVTLPVVDQQPAVGDDATAASLGIGELVASASTYFRGSTSARIQNIETAGLSFHGLLIAPGETFSMGDALGDVSLENGYEEAMIIYNGRTIKGVGGGVCQVSTTLFRTAFFGGYPIVERTPHAYRVSYYEQDAYGHDASMAGLDATVYFPLVDLKFTNDRPYWLLMEVYVNRTARRITWKFYSTNDGRSVDWTTTGPVNVVPAPPADFELTTDLGPDEMEQVDWPADGADVTVNRTVTRNGIVLFSDVIATHYQPWQAVCNYGAGMDNWVGIAAELGLCQAP